MSLFPAYDSGESSKYVTNSDAAEKELDWLSLPSGKSDEATLSLRQFDPEQKAVKSYASDKGQLSGVRESQKRKVSSYESNSGLSSDNGATVWHQRKEEKEKMSHRKHKKKKRKRSLEKTDQRQLHHRGSEVEDLSDVNISQLPPSDKVFIEAVLPPVKTPYAFSLDKRPDKDNLFYGSFYSTKIAKYRLFGCLKNRSYMTKSKSKSEASTSRYFSPREQKLVEFCDKVTVPMDFDDNGFSDYVPLESKKYSAEENRDISSGIGLGNIQDKGDAGIRKKVEDYNSRLAADPHDETLWLEFVEFQKMALCLKQEHQRSKDDVESWLKVDGRTLTEIKCAILEKAVEKNPSSKALRLAQLELIGSIWDLEKLSHEWKKLVFSFANDADVWLRYLRFVQCSFSTFTVSRVVGVYAKCLATLDAIANGTMTSHKMLPNTVDQMIEIFDHLCVFLHQSGHTERAVALFQAQLEYNLFCPSVLAAVTPSDRIDFLSAFWDSGAPRLGEMNAQGWAQWVTEKGNYNIDSSDNWSSRKTDEGEEEKLLEEYDDQCKLWLVFENSRMCRHWLPWKQSMGGSEEEDECEDTERIVLFEDIAKCMFCVESEKHRFVLLSKFFDFLDRLCDAGVMNRSSSYLTGMEYASEIFKDRDSELFLPHLSSRPRLENCRLFRSNVLKQVSDKFDGNLKTFLYLSEIDFRANQSTQCSDDEQKLLKKELKKFMKTLLSTERNNLAIWQRYAAFEFQNGNLRDARKVFDTAITTWCSADFMRDIKGYEACVTSLFYRTYASLEFGVEGNASDENSFHSSRKRSFECGAEGNAVRTLSILVALSEGNHSLSFDTKFPPTKLLKCQRNYEQTLETLFGYFCTLTEEDTQELFLRLRYVGETLVHWFECFAVFHYLTNGIEAMSAFAEIFLGRISSSYYVADKPRTFEFKYKQTVNQMCAEAYINLLRYHVSNYISPLRTLRTPLLSFLEEFRESCSLLQVFVDLESSFSIAGHLRKYFHESVSLAKSPVVPLFAVLSEFKRMHNLKLNHTGTVAEAVISEVSCEVLETGVTNQLRAWFEVATNQPTTQHCILIWRLYLYFEAQMNNHNNVKAVFYRSLQQCPWAKSIYMDCVRYAPDMLQEVNDLMMEKELKVRTPLEELSLLMSGKESLANSRHEDETTAS